MADLTIEDLQRLVAQYEATMEVLGNTGNIEAAKKALSGMSPIMQDMRDMAMTGTGSIRGLQKAFSELDIAPVRDQFNRLKATLTEAMKEAEISEKQFMRLSASIGSIFLVATGKLQISSEMMALTGHSKDATAQLTDMSKTLGAMLPKSGKLGSALSGLGGMLGNVFKHADTARNLETSLLRAAAAGGDFERMMSEMGGTMGGLTDQSVRFIDLTTNIATANNITADAAVKYATDLMKIPGAMRETVSATSDGLNRMHMLDAVLKVASGTFQDVNTVMKDVDMIFQKFGKTGADSLSVVSRMHSAAQALNIPMQNMRGVVDTAAESFKFLGDNSQAAITIMSRMSGALKDSGLGPQAIQQLTGNFTSLISQMDMAQRAFVSSQTGGPGGLQGAFQMRLDMREGRGEDVAARVEQTLRQMMGGQLVTLEEAATDSRAAAQMAKQVQMLTSGPLKVAQDEGQAERIIQAMTTGDLFGAAREMQPGGTPEDALQNVVKAGNDIQERQASSLLMIHNELQKQSNLAGQIIEADRRQIEGTEGSMRGSVLESRRIARVEAQRFPAGAGGLDREIQRTMSGIRDGTAKLSSSAQNMADRVAGNISGMAPRLVEQAGVDLRQRNERSDVESDMSREMRRQTRAANMIRSSAGMQEELHVPIPRELREWENRQAQQTQTQQNTRPQQEVSANNEVIIKVMGQKDVERLIKVTFDKLGQMHVQEAFGMER